MIGSRYASYKREWPTAGVGEGRKIKAPHQMGLVDRQSGSGISGPLLKFISISQNMTGINKIVIPAKRSVDPEARNLRILPKTESRWIPAFAGMTNGDKGMANLFFVIPDEAKRRSGIQESSCCLLRLSVMSREFSIYHRPAPSQSSSSGNWALPALQSDTSAPVG